MGFSHRLALFIFLQIVLLCVRCTKASRVRQPPKKQLARLYCPYHAPSEEFQGGETMPLYPVSCRVFVFVLPVLFPRKQTPGGFAYYLFLLPTRRTPLIVEYPNKSLKQRPEATAAYLKRAENKSRVQISVVLKGMRGVAVSPLNPSADATR